MNLLRVWAAALACTTACQAQFIDFNGTVQAANLTGFDWVLGSKMWGTVETADGTASGAGGLNSLNGLDLSKFTFSFGDLELSSQTVPTLVGPGQENYTEVDQSVKALEFFFNGDLWASGLVSILTVDVSDINDNTATGAISAQLTAAGPNNNAFFNEVLSVTGGTGKLDVTISNFFPVNNAGLFNSAGRISFVPEPSTYTLVSAIVLAVFTVIRRSRISRSSCALPGRDAG